MKKRLNNIVIQAKKTIISITVNAATIFLELYDTEREKRQTLISEKKRRKYKLFYRVVNVINMIVLFAINYLIMWIVWKILMNPPFGKAKYTVSFEENHVILITFFSVIICIECMKCVWKNVAPEIDKYIHMIRYVPISGMIFLYFRDLGKLDIIFQLFYLYILHFTCNSLIKAMYPIIYPESYAEGKYPKALKL